MANNFSKTKQYILTEIKLLKDKIREFEDDIKKANKKVKQYITLVQKLKNEVKILQIALKILKSRIYE